MTDTVTEKGSEVTEQVGDQVSGNGNGSVAKKLLIPAAAGVGTLAATYAATKAPGLLRDKVMPKVEERGGEEAAKMGEEAVSKLSEKGGIMGAVGKVAGAGKSSRGREKTRRLPIQRWTDVAVPVDTAFEKWTEFEEFPKFMHRVLNVERKDDNLISWQEKIWFSTRQWEAEILEQKKNDRIVWKTTQGTSHIGVISFHKLDANLTRVMVTLDFHPSGILEKMASGLRFVKRAVQADLARFKAYAELGEAEGAEYTQASTTEDQNEDQDENEDNGGDDDAQARSNGRGESGEGDDERSREEAEESRQQRAERREERRS